MIWLRAVNPNLPAGEYLSLPEVGERTGIPLETLRAYRSRPLKTNPFPPPLDEFKGAEIWRAEDIDAWVAKRPGKGWRKGQPDPV